MTATSPKQNPFGAVVSPWREMGAYEALWLEPGATVKRLADQFRGQSNAYPSDLVAEDRATECARQVHQKVLSSGVSRFGVKIHRAGEYPTRLRDARNPVELLYHRGEWELTETRSVAIVGARKATDDGKRRAQRLARLLVEANFTIASGLAEGIDTAAHEAALHAKGRTIAVVGTPIHTVYPRQNASLQERIAAEHLVISQVPVLKYDQQTYRENRSFFPERNATMSALTEATVIVEASDTSGTLIQARAALYQGRKVFILDSCFKRTDIRWPSEFEKKGAVRVRDIEDVVNTLG